MGRLALGSVAVTDAYGCVDLATIWFAAAFALGLSDVVAATVDR